MTHTEEQAAMFAADRITAELVRARYERDEANLEIQRLREALTPLALVATKIDGHPGGRLRPDSATLWQRYAYEASPFDLTVGHARAARVALEGPRYVAPTVGKILASNA